jgi:hypothetical protein
MRIIKIKLTHLHVEEWFRLLCDLLELIPLYGASKLGIAKLLALLIPLRERADKLLVILRKSVHTEEMKNADKERDTSFRGLYNVVKAYRHLPLAADKETAKQLFVLLSGYRKLVLNSGYAEESAALYNLLQDLKGKYAPDVSQLGLGQWVANLEAAEQKFLAFRSERTKEDIEKPVEHLDGIRKEVDALYRSITEVLYAQLVADGLGGDVAVDPDSLRTGIYEDDIPPEQTGNVVYNFVIAWNQILKRYNAQLAAREGRRAKEKETEDDEPDEPMED